MHDTINELLSLDCTYNRHHNIIIIYECVDETRHTVKIEVEHQSGIIKLIIIIMAGFLRLRDPAPHSTSTLHELLIMRTRIAHY